MATSRSLFLPVPGVSDESGQLSRMVQFLGDFPPALIEASSPYSLQYFEPDGRFKQSIPHVSLQALVISILARDDNGPVVSSEEITLFADFLAQATCLDPSERPTAEELLMHPWMDDMLKRSICKYEKEQNGGDSDDKV